MKQNVKIAIITIPCTVVAFLAGFFVRNLPFTENIGLGDVGRAKVYTKNVVDVNVDNVQERLLSDSLYLSQVAGQALSMSSQAHNLSSLVEKTNALVGNTPAFKATIASINGAGKTIDNACNNLDVYLNSLDNLAGGKNVARFEQIYNNALLSYYLVSKKSQYGEVFGREAAAYLQSEQAADTAAVKNLWGEWLAFELADNLMSGNAKGAKEVLEVSDNNGLGALEKLQMFNQEYIQKFTLERPSFMHPGQEQLSLLFSQEQLSLIFLGVLTMCYPDQEQLFMKLSKVCPDQEQLNVIMRHLNQEKLNIPRDQEQLNIALDQEQLNVNLFDQEQLNTGLYDQEQLNLPKNEQQINIRPNQEQLNKPNQEQLNVGFLNQEQLNVE